MLPALWSSAEKSNRIALPARTAKASAEFSRDQDGKRLCYDSIVGMTGGCPDECEVEGYIICVRRG
jgi:hypothetical protein